MVSSARQLGAQPRHGLAGPGLEPDMAAQGWRVPEGREVELPGRGTTFVRELPGPSPKAPTVVLLHGLAATGGLNWFSCFGDLSERFRVVAVDHRGHGRGIRGQGRFRLADCADDVVALADVLGIEKFIPVGYSMGGPIGQLIWHRHKERVSGLVMCATSRNFRGRPRERVQFLGLGMLVAGMGGRVRVSVPWDTLNASRVRRVFESMLTPELVNGPVRPWMMSELQRNDTSTVLEAAEAIGRYSSHAWISQIDVPVSVVVTTRDWLVPVRRQVKLARSIPSAVVFPIDGDHLVCANQPEAFGRVVADACRLVERRIRRRPGAERAGLTALD